MRPAPRTDPSTAATPLRGPARSGYTLIELMVVIVILGLTAGVVMVSWEALLPNQYLNSDVRTLAARLHGARNDAISRSAEFRIHYQIDENRYWIETPYRKGGGAPRAEEDPHLIIDETELHDGVEISSVTVDGREFINGQVFVRFDPLGACNDHSVVLYQRPFERSFTVEVLGLTGQIKFHDGFYQREPAQDADFN